MILIRKHFLILFIVLLFTDGINSQPKTDFTLRQDFVPLLDSLIMPPSDCDKAFALMDIDSSSMTYIKNPLLEQQDAKIQNIFNELSAKLKKSNNDLSKFMPPPDVKGPPGGIGPPPDLGDIREEYLRMKDDLDDANIAMDKITVENEKIKDELTLMQSNVNKKLRETLESDDKARESIINEFLNSGVKKYLKYKKTVRVNLIVLDEIAKKYDYGNKIRIIQLKAEILNLQMAEVSVLKMLMKVTNEFVNIGVKFHR